MTGFVVVVTGFVVVVTGFVVVVTGFTVVVGAGVVVVVVVGCGVSVSCVDADSVVTPGTVVAGIAVSTISVVVIGRVGFAARPSQIENRPVPSWRMHVLLASAWHALPKHWTTPRQFVWHFGFGAMRTQYALVHWGSYVGFGGCVGGVGGTAGIAQILNSLLEPSHRHR